jgi:hypothetical protein
MIMRPGGGATSVRTGCIPMPSSSFHRTKRSSASWMAIAASTPLVSVPAAATRYREVTAKASTAKSVRQPTDLGRCSRDSVSTTNTSVPRLIAEAGVTIIELTCDGISAGVHARLIKRVEEAKRPRVPPSAQTLGGSRRHMSKNEQGPPRGEPCP